MEQTVEDYICLVQMPQVRWPSLGTVQSIVLFGTLGRIGLGASAHSNDTSEYLQHQQASNCISVFRSLY